MKKNNMIISVVAVVLISELLTPWAVSRVLGSSLSKVMPSRSQEISSRTLPGISLLLGRFDKVRSVSQDAVIDGLRIQRVQVAIDDAAIDIGELFGSSRIRVKQVRNLEIMMQVNEKDLAEYMATKIKEVKNPKVRILQDKIEIRGDVDLGLIKVTAGVDGRIVGDSQSIRFRSDRLEVGSAGGINFGALFAEIPLIDLTKLPFQVAVRKVITEKGVITVYADHR